MPYQLMINVDCFWETVEAQRKEGRQIYFLPSIELKTDKGDKETL